MQSGISSTTYETVKREREKRAGAEENVINLPFVRREVVGPCGGSCFLSQTPALHCETTDTGLVHRAVCLFTPHLSLVLIAPTHRGEGELTWVAGYIPR